MKLADLPWCIVSHDKKLDEKLDARSLIEKLMKKSVMNSTPNCQEIHALFRTCSAFGKTQLYTHVFKYAMHGISPHGPAGDAVLKIQSTLLHLHLGSDSLQQQRQQRPTALHTGSLMLPYITESCLIVSLIVVQHATGSSDLGLWSDEPVVWKPLRKCLLRRCLVDV